MELLGRARGLAPTDRRVIEALISTAEGKEEGAELWAGVVSDLREAIGACSTDSILYEQLSEAQKSLGDILGEKYALSSLSVLEPLSENQESRLMSLNGKTAAPTVGRCGQETFWEAVGAGDLEGPIGAVWRDIAPRVAAQQPKGGTELGFAKSERVRLKDMSERFPRLAEAMDALSCSFDEVFISAKKSDFARVLGVDSPVLLLAYDTASMESPLARYRVGWALAQAKWGVAPVLENSPAELDVWMAGAARLAGNSTSKLEASVGRTAQVEEMRKFLQKLPRKVRKRLEQRKQGLADVDGTSDFRESCILVCDRAGLALAGDMSVVAGVSESTTRMRLLAWGVGEVHASLAALLFSEGGV